MPLAASKPEAQLQEPKAPVVAAHLRAQIAELQGRKPGP